MTTIPYVELKKSNSEFEKKQILNSKIAYDYIRQFYYDDIDIFESFFILMLNNQKQTIGFAKIAQGGINAVYVDIKLIAKFAVEHLADGIIIAHNHPSGSIFPSTKDIELTEKIKKGLSILDIYLFDHVILTREKYYSFGDSDNL